MDAEHVGMSARWFNLTLVKGDEGVEAGEEGADGTLLGEGGRNRKVRFPHQFPIGARHFAAGGNVGNPLKGIALN